MLHSFRLKIGLMSSVVSGLLLLGFATFATSALNRVGLDRIDRELRALADTQVRKPQPTDHWQRFDESLRSIYGADAAKQFVVLTTLSNGTPLYTSPNWPPDLPAGALPLPLEPTPTSSSEQRPPNPDNPPPPPPDEPDTRRPPPSDDNRPPRPQSRPAPDPADTRPPRNRDTPAAPQRQPPPPPRRMQVRGPAFATIHGPASQWRAMSMANEEITLSLAMNLAVLHAETHRFRRALLITVPLGLLLVAAGGWLIGQMALRPVNRIARKIETLTARHLAERIPHENADAEFKRLIVLFNDMLERLDRSFQQATRFSADAAHELKTPLAILQAQTERCLQRAPDSSPEQHEYAEQLDEIQRLRAILRKLLLLAQADAGQLPLGRESIDLVTQIRSIADDARILAPDRKISVQTPGQLLLSADPELLNQAIENLVSNAVKFGNTNGSIHIELATQNNLAVLTVSNTGIPIPEADHARLFNRFYRASKSRNRAIEGSGLGLSLAREIARAHTGDLHLAQSNETMTSFVLKIPIA